MIDKIDQNEVEKKARLKEEKEESILELRTKLKETNP